MVQYVIRRLLQMIPMLFILSIVLFALVNIVPGGPLAGQGQSRRVRPEQAEMLKRQLPQPAAARSVRDLASR
jgi:peptide/nickel transport system permease protein